jgi:hypothetical protein
VAHAWEYLQEVVNLPFCRLNSVFAQC